MSPRKVNTTAMRRQRATLVQQRSAEPHPLPAEFVNWLRTQYLPDDPRLQALWPKLLPFVEEALTRSRIRGEASLHRNVTHLVYFSGWLAERGLPLHVGTSLVRRHIDEYCRVGMPGNSDKSRSDRRGRLRGIADHVNPEQAPDPTQSIARPSVRPPYAADQMAAFRRLAPRQPTADLARQTCLCVGVGGGAGIDSPELKLLLGSHVVDLGEDGIRIDVPGPRARTVWILREYEELVRRGLVGIRPNQPVLGRKQNRANVASDVYARAKIYGHLPALDQSRLRTTWLATLLTRPVPLAVICAAAGLKSTRTLFDLLPHLTAQANTPSTLQSLLRDGHPDGTR